MRKEVLVFKRELVRQLKNWKVIVVLALMLVIMFGLTYSLSQFSTAPVSEVQPLAAALNDSGHLDVRVYAVNGVGSPVSVGLSLQEFASQGPTNGPPPAIASYNFSTGDDGFATVKTDIDYSSLANQSGPVYYYVSLVSASGFSTTSTGLNVGSPGAQVSSASVVSPSNSSIPGTVVFGVNPDGSPLSAKVYVGGDYKGNLTDGVFTGFYDVNGAFVTVSYDGVANQTVGILYRSTTTTTTTITSNELVVSLSQSFLGFFVPIAAILAGYDAVAKERVTGAMELILSRPVSKSKVYWGKAMGAFVAMDVYFAVVAVLFYFFALHSGVTLSLSSVFCVYIGTAFLLFIFIIFESITGFFGRSSSGPIVWGVVLWVLFEIVFSTIAIIPYLLLGGAANSAHALAFSNYFNLANPIHVSTLLMSLPFFGSSGMADTFYGLSVALIVVCAVVWVALVVALYVLTIRKKE